MNLRSTHPKAFKELANGLDLVFKRETKERRQAFFEAARNSLISYQDDIVPALLDDDLRPTRLNDLIESGQAFAAAVAKIDGNTRFLLEQAHIVFARKQGFAPQAAVAKASGAMSELTSAAVAAKLNATIAGRIKSRPQTRSPLPTLIEMVAYSYETIFGEKPSAAGEGRFSKALHVILDAEKIEKKFGEKALGAIFKRIDLVAPAPRRGPKKIGQ